MATIYVNSGAAGAANGTSWTDAYLTLAAALAGTVSAGDIIKVHNAHSHTANAGITLTWPNVAFSIICVDKDNSDALSTGAVEAIGNSNNSMSIVSNNSDTAVYVYGIQFDGANGAHSSGDIGIETGGNNAGRVNFVNCKFRILSTNSSANMTIGQTAGGSQNRHSRLTFRNCEFTLPNRTGSPVITIGNCDATLINPTFVYAGASKPTTVFNFSNTSCVAKVEILDADITGIDSGNIFDITNFGSGNLLLRNVRYHASATLVANSFPDGTASITLINSDSGDTLNVFSYRNREGTLTQTGSIYASSGAEFAGSGIGWSIVTTALCDESNPFIVPILMRWQDSAATITATVEFVHDSATSLHNRNMWSELSYTSSSSNTIGTNNSTRNSSPFLGSSSNHGAGAATWTGTGGFSNENKQKLSHATIAVSEKCLLELKVYVAAASKTVYIDPLIRIA